MTRVLITGGTSGLGFQSAMNLSKMGYEVAITSRSEDRAKLSAEQIHGISGNEVQAYQLDLSDLDSVREFPKLFEGEIEVLLNNAGAMYSTRKMSKQGIEMTLAGNHLGHFLLTNQLVDRITPKGRIINVSSAAHNGAVFDFEDYNRERKYSMMGVYGESKLANLFFTFKLAEKLKGPTVNALHPGFVATNFAKNNGMLYKILLTLTRPFQKSQKNGARTQTYLASSDEVQGTTGKYFVNSKVENSSAESRKRENWDRMWELSEKLCDIQW